MPKKKKSAEIRYREVLSKRRPGETLVALAARRGVKLRWVYHWHQKLNRRERDAPKSAKLLPVRVLNGQGLGPILSAPDFEVALKASGHLLKVPAKFDSAGLRSLVEILEGSAR